MSVILLILGLLLFVSLVVVHEWGHFIAARRSGVGVDEFGLGFPPQAKILGKKNGTVYSLNWLPLGGFVRLKGEHDADTAAGSYGAARLSNKVKIMLAGVFMNLVASFALLTVLALTGMPQLVKKQFTIPSDSKVSTSHVLIGYVEPGSPAAKAGIKEQDRFEAIGLAAGGGLHTITSSSKVPEITKQLAGQQVTVAYRRGDALKEVNLMLRDQTEVAASKSSSNPKGYLGISPTDYQLRRSTWSAPLVALGVIWQFTALTLQGLGHALAALFTGHGAQASAQVAGPVGVFVILQKGTHLGLPFVLMLIAIISLTLAIMNVLPIPALDGGRLFVTMLYRALRKPLPKDTEDRIHGTGFAVLMLLILVITLVDIKRFF